MKHVPPIHGTRFSKALIRSVFPHPEGPVMPTKDLCWIERVMFLSWKLFSPWLSKTALEIVNSDSLAIDSGFPMAFSSFESLVCFFAKCVLCCGAKRSFGLKRSLDARKASRRPKQPKALAIAGKELINITEDCSSNEINVSDVNALLIVNSLRGSAVKIANVATGAEKYGKFPTANYFQQ